MIRWLRLVLPLLVLTVVACWSRSASACTHPEPKSRVGVFDLTYPACLRPSLPPAVDNDSANRLFAYELASSRRLRWKGRWFDPAMGGSYDMRARWWSPQMGAFLQLDEYAYHDRTSTLWGWPGQDPLKWSDPYGRAGVGIQFTGVSEFGVPPVGGAWQEFAGVFLSTDATAGIFGGHGGFEGENLGNALGGFLGAGFSAFLSNASDVSDLSGKFTTYSGNVGIGPIQIGLSFSYANGVWVASLSPPGAGLGFGASYTQYQTDTTYTEQISSQPQQQACK